MNNKQIIAIIAPLILMGVMYPIFQILNRTFKGNWRMGWYLGLVIYWILWGGIFPWLLIGKTEILKLIQPERLTLQIFILVLIPLIGAGLYRMIPGMDYDKPSVWIFLLLVSTNIGNGFFEEVLWRGVYLELFPTNILLSMLWPSLWFALWHYIPGSVAPDGNTIGLMIGSGFMGFYLSFLAKKTGTIWWTILMHTIGGFIMIL